MSQLFCHEMVLELSKFNFFFVKVWSYPGLYVAKIFTTGEYWNPASLESYRIPLWSVIKVTLKNSHIASFSWKVVCDFHLSTWDQMEWYALFWNHLSCSTLIFLHQVEENMNIWLCRDKVNMTRCQRDLFIWCL